MVPGHGFEPWFTASKAAVLPLDDPGMQDFRISPIFGLLRRKFAQRTKKYVSRTLLLAHRNWSEIRKS